MEAKMATTTFAAVVLLVCAMAMVFQGAAAAEKLYKETFRSPGFTLGPGDVIDQYYRVEMPKGHIAIRSFNTQVVDQNGVPVPLYETYLHHWVLHRYYMPTSSGLRERIPASNWGPCQSGSLRQLFGLGSETRNTATEIPAPYGIVVGDPEEVPVGYEESWVLNVHAIDTRGAVDKRSCFECLCEAYNITVDPSSGQHKIPMPETYIGGLECCRDAMHCAVEPAFEGPKRTLFMEYYVEWVEMSDDVVPVKVYIFDVTDGRTSVNGQDHCLVEYLVPQCGEGEATCIHTEENVNFLSTGGDIIYGVAHQHAGGIGSTLYNEDGEELCSSIPTYGDGNEPGNEAGYITGMSTCYPQPGTKKIRGGEKLRMKSWYNNEVRHTGVMGLFYLLVDESAAHPPKADYHDWMLVVAALIAAVILIGAIVTNHIRTKRSGPEYERINI